LSNIQFHDCMTNMLPITVLIKSIIEKSTKNVIILIDSLSIYLIKTEFSKTYKEILDITTSDKGK